MPKAARKRPSPWSREAGLVWVCKKMTLDSECKTSAPPCDPESEAARGQGLVADPFQWPLWVILAGQQAGSGGSQGGGVEAFPSEGQSQCWA